MTRIRTQQEINLTPEGSLYLFFLAGGKDCFPTPTLQSGGADFSLDWRQLSDTWWLLEAHSKTPLQTREVDVYSDAEVTLTGIRVVTGSRVRRISFAGVASNDLQRTTAAFAGRWSRSPAKFLAPLPRDRQVSMLLLMPQGR
jgi:hypothetical protein